MEKIFTPIGASNHSLHNREKHDYYATEPKATKLLLEHESFNQKVWECCCGEGHMSEVLKKEGYEVLSTDLIDRGYGDYVMDFLSYDGTWEGDIITNPPYKYALEFVEKALDSINDNSKVAMFLKLTFLEGKKRKKFFKENPPKRIYISSSRLMCAKNGEFERYKSSAVAYAWFIWEKGYKGKPEIEWIN